MTTLDRRGFIRVGAIGTTGLGLGMAATAAGSVRSARSHAAVDTAKGVHLPVPQGERFLVGVNETLNRSTAAELAAALVRAATG